MSSPKPLYALVAGWRENVRVLRTYAANPEREEALEECASELEAALLAWEQYLGPNALIQQRMPGLPAKEGKA